MGIAKHRESYFGRVRRPAYGKRGIRQAHLDRPGAGTDISRAVLPNNGGGTALSVAASGEGLRERLATEEAVDEQTALLGPHRMHGRAGFPAAALPAVRMGPCISFLLITCSEHPGSALAELDAESFQSQVQFPPAHAQLLGDLCGRIGA